jgi:hypothetical protein
MGESGAPEPAGRRRHAVLWFRLVFYPAAAVIVALLLWSGRVTADGGEATAPEPELAEVLGETDEYEPIVLKFDDAGVLRSWDVRLEGSCDNGQADDHQWAPSDTGAPARIQRHGDRVEAVERTWLHHIGTSQTDHLEMTLRARVGPDRVTGLLRYTKRVEHDGAVTVLCSSPPVRFSASRDD